MKPKTSNNPVVESTAETNEPKALNAPVLPLELEAPASFSEPNSQKASPPSGKKQKKAELDRYKVTFLSPYIVTNKHGVNIEDALWEEVDLVVRRLGDRGSSASAFINNLIREHLVNYRQSIEDWRKL